MRGSGVPATRSTWLVVNACLRVKGLRLGLEQRLAFSVSVFSVSGFGFRVSGFGFRVSGSGFRVSCFEFRAPGSGFRVSGLACSAELSPGWLMHRLRVRFMGNMPGFRSQG